MEISSDNMLLEKHVFCRYEPEWDELVACAMQPPGQDPAYKNLLASHVFLRHESEIARVPWRERSDSHDYTIPFCLTIKTGRHRL